MKSPSPFRSRILQRSLNSAETGDPPTQSSTESKFLEAVRKLRRVVSNVQAVILAGPQGIVHHAVNDPAMDTEVIGHEFATLLRIAQSASEDSGAGNVIENILVSEKSIMIARLAFAQHYLILWFRSQDQIGRARYELKQACRVFTGRI